MYRNALSVLRSAASFAVGLALVVSAAGWLAGCGSNDPSKERSAKAVAGLRETREELAASRAQLDKTQAALDRLQAGQGDLVWSYNAYKDEVRATENRAKSAAAQANPSKSASASVNVVMGLELAACARCYSYYP